MSRSIQAALAAALGLLVMPGPAAQAGTIERLTAGPDAMYAIRDGDVLTFDQRGAVTGRCSRFAASTARHAPVSTGAPDPAETLRLAGLPDDDSTLEAEELLEDEGSPPRGSRLAAIAAVLPRALAADRDGVWIATSDGLFHSGPGGCRRAALAGRDLVAVATDGRTIAAASRDLLFRGQIGPVGEIALGPPLALTDDPRALAVDPQGGVLIAGDAGLMRAGIDGAIAQVADRPTEALAVCGQTVLALTADAVMLWDGPGAARVAARPPVKAVACAGGARAGWVAAGLGVWRSSDAAGWTEVPEALGLDVAGVVSLGGLLWVAAGDGLAPLRPQPGLGGARPSSRGTATPPPARPVAPPAWRLPIVTAALLVDQTPLRRAVTGMLLLTFPLGRRLAAAAAGDVAAQRLRRGADLAREEAALGWAAGESPGDLEADEAAARLAAVRDEREAPP